jgi:hypothetical protein
MSELRESLPPMPAEKATGDHAPLLPTKGRKLEAEKENTGKEGN